MQPNSYITTTTNQYLAPRFMDLTLRDNFLFGELMRNTDTFKGSQMLIPKLYGDVKSVLIYGETPNYAIA